MTTTGHQEDTARSDRNLYAFAISFVAAVGGFLFGFDLVIISSAQLYLRDLWKLNDFWYGFTTASANFGCIAGPFLGGWLCDAIGRKMTLVVASLLLAVSAIVTALAPEMISFNLFRFVGGLGVGLASLASPMYIVEVAPPRIRGGLGIMFQLAIAIGALSSAICGWLLAKYVSPDVSWRWMFGSEMAAIVLFVVALYFVPRSPRWLAEKGRWEESLAVLTKVDGPEYARKEMEGIKASLTEEQGTFSELIRPGMRMALLVGILLALFNNWTGWSAMSYYVPTLFEKAGVLNRADAIYQNVLINGWQVFLTLMAIFLVDRFGRKFLWLSGSGAMAVFLVVAGLMFHYNLTGIGVLLVMFLCVTPHAMALGPMPWLMMSELYPTRLRAKAVAITTTVIWIAGWSSPFLFPVITGFSERTIGSVGGAFWMFTIICILAFIFGLKLLPETKGRTLEEIGKSWHPK